MLVNSIEIIQEKVKKVASSLQWEDLETSVETVEMKHIKPLLGSAFYNSLNNKFNESSPNLSNKEKALQNLIHYAVSYLAVVEWIPEGILTLTGSGIYIPKTADMSIPWQWQTDKMEFSCLNKGFSGLDDILEFLEENKDEADFDLWEQSGYYTIIKDLFVNNTKEFNKYYSINNSRRIFLRLAQTMRKVEDFYAISNLGRPYYDELKEKIKEEDLEEDDEKIINEFLNKAIVYQTIAIALAEGMLELGPDGVYINVFNTGTQQKNNPSDQRLYTAANKAKMDSFNYFQQMRNYLNENASNQKYATYFNSPQYTDPSKLPGVTNKKSNSFYAAK